MATTSKPKYFRITNHAIFFGIKTQNFQNNWSSKRHKKQEKNPDFAKTETARKQILVWKNDKKIEMGLEGKIESEENKF